jgi:membrane protease YdiL (CAAX protease family)
LKNGLLQHLKPWEKVLYFFAVLILGWFLAQTVSILLCQSVFEIDLTNYDFQDYSRIDVIRLNKILNLITHLFLFIIPAFFFSRLISFDYKEFVLLKKPNRKTWLMVPFLFVGFTILNELLYAINHSIDFSGVSAKFQESLEYEQAVRTKAVYAYVGTTWKSFITNLFLIALIPAIGEELTFRGVLQHLFTKATNNIYVGVVLSAFLFALIHFQPFNFLPIFALGLMYGFIVIYTGSIWISIILHFANNALSISFMHLERYYGWQIETNLLVDVLVLLISAGVVFFLIKKNPQMSKWNEVRGVYLR